MLTTAWRYPEYQMKEMGKTDEECWDGRPTGDAAPRLVVVRSLGGFPTPFAADPA